MTIQSKNENPTPPEKEDQVVNADDTTMGIPMSILLIGTVILLLGISLIIVVIKAKNKKCNEL